MSFPGWAPAALVEVFNRLQDNANDYRRYDEEAKSDASDFGDLLPLTHQYDWNEAAEKTDRQADTLRRLLTHFDMEDAWVALSRPTVHPRYKDHAAHLLWDCIVRALQDFPDQIKVAQTPAQKAKSLQSISRQAQNLIDAIAADPACEGIANGIMATHLAIRNIEHRQSMGDTPSPAEFAMPLTLSADCDEARRVSLEEEPDDDCKWNQLPLVNRLAYWANESNETHLNDLLHRFIEAVQAVAEHPPEIAQPGRGADALKPFLIRRVGEFVDWYYGQPLDDTVARIVTVVLDLPRPLTRDDVRPYSRGGKKRARSA